MLDKFKKKFIGDKKFYKTVMTVAVPIMIQNGITNFVSLLDNIMVGRVGTEQMSGVAIVNQLLFVYYLCIFGGLAGAGIFTAQYFGQKDDEGIRHTFRYKIWMALGLTIIAYVVFSIFGENLIKVYLSDADNGGNIVATLAYGKTYLKYMFLGMPAFMIVQVYVSTLRECGETVVPMKAGIYAVLVNLLLDYLLIYGKLGMPALGVKGAAIATVVSRYIEAFVVIFWAHRHTEKIPYIKGIYKTLKVPAGLVKKFFILGIPLLVNEALWSAGQAMLTQCYSVRGLNVVAGLNIANTLNSMFNIMFLAMGNAVAIIVGQLLGAGKLEEARDTDNKIIAFSVFSCVILGIVMIGIAPFFPELYNTGEAAKEIATYFIIAQAVFMPQIAFINCIYFTLRSGGKTVVTFLFDSVYVWGINISIAYILSRMTGINVITIFVLVQVADWIKCIIGFILVKKGVWLKNIVEN